MISETIKIELASNPELLPLLGNFVEHAAGLAEICDDRVLALVRASERAFLCLVRYAYSMSTINRILLTLIICQRRYLELIFVDKGEVIPAAEIANCHLEEIIDIVNYTPGDDGNRLRLTKYLPSSERPCAPTSAEKEGQLLKTLLDIGQSLPKILDLDKLLILIADKIKELMHIEGVSVILLDQDRNELVFHTVLDENLRLVKKLQGFRFPSDKGIAGRVVQTGQPTLVSDVSRDPDHFTEIDRSVGGITTSLLYAPLKVHDRVIGVLSAKNKRGSAFSQADLNGLAAIASTVALSIDNARAHERLKQSSRIEKEIQAARMMHQATLPQVLPKISGMTLSAVCHPATEVGGDYYVFFPLAAGEKYAFAIGDVSGHGLESGMMVSMAHSCLFTQINFSWEIEAVMAAMNRMIYDGVKRRLIMTFWFSIYDLQSRVLSFANAGHPPPYYYCAARDSWQLIQEGEFPLGIFKEHIYQNYSRRFFPGDFLLLYSDGIIEARNEAREKYGLLQLAELLAGRRWQSPEQIKNAILADVDQFSVAGPPEDDRTLLVLAITNP